MNAKQLIELNNEKRKLLSKENLKYYEDMLVYIRLSYDKSELETEEVLSELLDHLLEAQKEGKTGKDVFGDHPKQYADEIIGELPKMVTKERFQFFTMIICYFVAVSLALDFVSILIKHFLFKSAPLTKEIFVTSFTLKTVLSVPLTFFLLYLLIQLLRWTCFKNWSKLKEYFIYWVYFVIAFGIYFILFWMIPDIGPVVDIPAYIILIVGIIVFFIGRIMQKSL